jgi:hypothetical protein
VGNWIWSQQKILSRDKQGIARLYKRFGKVVIITKKEREHLDQCGYKDHMPEDWGEKDEDWDAKDPFARYQKAEIKWNPTL